MIRITVTGDITDIRKRLNDAKFRPNHNKRAWHRTVAEAELNGVLHALRPMRSWSDYPTPVIRIKLERVGINGELIRNEVMVFTLMPVGDVGGTNFLERFQNEVCVVQLSPNDCAPSTPDTEKKKETKNVDPNFF